MKKWNMIIDVAECTNCNLCTLSAMDEYVGNDWPGYAALMPKHGHKWNNILQKERGQVPMIEQCNLPSKSQILRRPRFAGARSRWTRIDNSSGAIGDMVADRSESGSNLSAGRGRDRRRSGPMVRSDKDLSDIGDPALIVISHRI